MRPLLNPIVCLILLYPLRPCGLNAQATPDWSSEMNGLLEAYSSNSFPFNGVLLIFDKEGILYERTQGFANFELQSPLRRDTKFRLASVSKQFAGFLAWQLAAEGRLDMEAPISRYVSRLEGSSAGRLTMQQLLTHTAGLPPDKYVWEYAAFHRSEPFDFQNFFDLIARDTVHFAPGSRYEYCNTCYVLAAGVMEQLTGSSFPELLREKILSPLGMKNTGLDSAETLLSNRAYNYEREFELGLRPAAPIDLSPISAAAGMYSTAEDLYHWARVLFFTDSLLTGSYRRRFFTPNLNDYAYGLFIREKNADKTGFSVPVMEHDGLLEGVRAGVIYLPEKETAIIILSNFGKSFPLAEFQREIINILYKRPFRAPKRSLSYHFACDLKRKGLEFATAQFQEHLPDTAHYELNLSKLNEYGYFLLRRGREEEAIAVFRLHVEACPDSWYAHDSLAEAYHKAGMPYLAIFHYEQALRLNPENRLCKRKLEELRGGG